MLVTIGSITTAARLARIIEKNTGAPAEVIHTPPHLNKGGCSYSVRFADKYAARARALINEYKVPARKFYSESLDGGQRVYHAVP